MIFFPSNSYFPQFKYMIFIYSFFHIWFIVCTLQGPTDNLQPLKKVILVLPKCWERKPSVLFLAVRSALHLVLSFTVKHPGDVGTLVKYRKLPGFMKSPPAFKPPPPVIDQNRAKIEASKTKGELFICHLTYLIRTRQSSFNDNFATFMTSLNAYLLSFNLV